MILIAWYKFYGGRLDIVLLTDQDIECVDGFMVFYWVISSRDFLLLRCDILSTQMTITNVIKPLIFYYSISDLSVMLWTRGLMHASKWVYILQHLVHDVPNTEWSMFSVLIILQHFVKSMNSDFWKLISNSLSLLSIPLTSFYLLIALPGFLCPISFFFHERFFRSCFRIWARSISASCRVAYSGVHSILLQELFLFRSISFPISH